MKRITKEVYDQMTTGPDGQRSSTRVMAFDTWVFLKRLIVIFLACLVLFGLIGGLFGIEIDKNILSNIMMFFVVTVFLMLLAIYAPKQFSKASEIKAMIETAKGVIGKEETKK